MPPPTTHSLTVKLDGVASAPVTVMNTTTNASVFSGTLEGSKTFASLKAGDVFKVEGGAVNGYTTPGAQTVTLDADKTVTLGYESTPTPTALNLARIQGMLPGWTFGAAALGVYFSLSGTVVDATSPTITSTGRVDSGLPTPGRLGSFLEGCTFNGERSTLDFGAELPEILAFSRQSDFLGTVTEQTSDGRPVTRLYSDTNATFTGTATCGTTELDLRLNLTRGWNAVQITELPTTTARNHYNVSSIEAGASVTLGFKRAEESSQVYFRDESPLTLRPGASATRDALFTQMGGLSGEVTLETDVPGIRVSPAKLTLTPLSGQSLPGVARRLIRTLEAQTRGLQAQTLGTTLTLTAEANAPAYTGPLQIIVRKGGTPVGGGTLPSVTVAAPAVRVYADPTRLTFLPQGETAEVTVTAFSENGFSGVTTLTLTGLPTGITASSETVTLGDGASAAVTLRLTASADASVGDFQGQVGGPAVQTLYGTPSTVAGKVTPRRTLLGDGAVTALTLASNGDLWGLQGGYVLQIRNQQVISRVALGDGVNGQALRVGPDGSVWASGTGSRALYRLAQGSVQTFPVGGYGDPTAPLSFGVDSAGRAWFMFFDGFNVPQLRRLNPITGEIVTIPTVKSASSGVAVTNDAAGEYVLFAAGDGTLVRVDTTTGASVASASPLYLGGMGRVRAYSLDRQGQLWVAVSGPDATLNRLNLADLSVAQRVNINGVANAGDGYKQVAVEDGETAWFLRQKALVRLDLATGAQEYVALEYSDHDLHSLSLAPGAGTAYTFGFQSSQPAPEYLRVQR